MGSGRLVEYTFDVIYSDTLEFEDILQKEDEWEINKTTGKQERKWKTLSFSELLSKKPYSRETYYTNYEKYTSEEFKKENPELVEKIQILSDTRKKIINLLEQRIVSGAMQNKFNPTFCIFNLKNNYGWKDKQEVDSNSVVEHKGKISMSLEDRIARLDESAKK
jgi:hypothetical protein